MATFRKRSSGWRVEVARRGIRDSATFKTKAQAAAWATQREADILAGKAQSAPDCSLREVMERYLAQETPKKRSAKAEEGHMLRLINTLPFVDKPIAQGLQRI